MTYQETVEWMFHQLPMYQLQGASAYKKDLTNTILLLEYLGNPQQNLKFIHVAGTNGKGSTSHLLASILQEAGYKVGLYTSPHLKDFRERITIIENDAAVDIAENFVATFITQHLDFFKQNELSFFEMSVGLAFSYFEKAKIDIAIIETGMGGRLDATNVIKPLVSVITNIGLDHTQFLGNTLEAIAFEKAGIIKPNVPIVIGEYTAETKIVFLNKAKQNNAAIYFASDLIMKDYPAALLGNYQIQNKKTVAQTISVLNAKTEFSVTETQLKAGFLNVIRNTKLQGRWQQLLDKPKVICDTAHNPHGLSVVMQQLQNEKFSQLHIVLGLVNDKILTDILSLFPKNAIYYFCKPNLPRGLDATVLQQAALNFELFGKVFPSVQAAYQQALANAAKSDFVYIGGSTFVVAEIL